MIENNKLENSFGPVGSISGVILFIAGLILIFFHSSAFILILIGALVGFSSTRTMLDYDKKRIKFSNILFGIIKIGQWFNIEANMKIGIKKSNLRWRAYSMGNRSLDIDNKDYWIMLFDSKDREIMPIKKCKSKDSAIFEHQLIGEKMGLSLF